MQSWILDKDFYKSASYLDRNRLQANIYENIHILASLLDVNDKLVNPKRNVKNHPASKLWIGYEGILLDYIYCHLQKWNRLGYRQGVNYKNFKILRLEVLINLIDPIPLWITDELIETHRSVLIQKEIEKENNFDFDEYGDKYCIKEKCQFFCRDEYGYCDYGYGCVEREEFINNKYEEFYHYRNLWPDTPTNLSMHYDWRNK